MNEPELKINGTYLVENDGTMQGMDIENKIYSDKLDINLSGQTPTGGYLEYENSKLKNGCLTFDEYKVTIENGEAKEVEKGSCENQSLTACDSPNFNSSPEEWFAFDASTNTITGPSNIWTSITDENLKKTDIVIPCQIGGVDVESIRGGSFSGRQLNSVIINDNIKTVGAGSFPGSQLSTVIVGDGVSTIGSGAFGGNKIVTLKLGNKIETIEAGAFQGNIIEELIIPDSVVTIMATAFGGNKIQNLSLGTKIENIGVGAFAGNNLKSVVIPSSVTNIERGGFAKDSLNNPNLTTIYNNTGKAFDWGIIVNGTSGYNFETGIVENEYGNVEIKKSS